jgi:hypothetical protein
MFMLFPVFSVGSVFLGNRACTLTTVAHGVCMGGGGGEGREGRRGRRETGADPGFSEGGGGG